MRDCLQLSSPTWPVLHIELIIPFHVFSANSWSSDSFQCLKHVILRLQYLFLSYFFFNLKINFIACSKCRCGSYDHNMYALDYKNHCCLSKIFCGGSIYGSPSIDMVFHVVLDMVHQYCSVCDLLERLFDILVLIFVTGAEYTLCRIN